MVEIPRPYYALRNGVKICHGTRQNHVACPLYIIQTCSLTEYIVHVLALTDAMSLSRSSG